MLKTNPKQIHRFARDDICGIFQQPVRLVRARRVSFRHVFEPDTAACPDALSRALHAAQEPRIILQAVIKPIIFRLKANQYSRRPTVAGDHDALFLLPIAGIWKDHLSLLIAQPSSFCVSPAFFNHASKRSQTDMEKQVVPCRSCYTVDSGAEVAFPILSCLRNLLRIGFQVE